MTCWRWIRRPLIGTAIWPVRSRRCYRRWWWTGEWAGVGKCLWDRRMCWSRSLSWAARMVQSFRDGRQGESWLLMVVVGIIRRPSRVCCVGSWRRDESRDWVPAGMRALVLRVRWWGWNLMGRRSVRDVSFNWAQHRCGRSAILLRRCVRHVGRVKGVDMVWQRNGLTAALVRELLIVTVEEYVLCPHESIPLSRRDLALHNSVELDRTLSCSRLDPMYVCTLRV